MKTFTEWIDKGVTKLRLPQWNEWAYLEILGNIGVLDSPWGKIYDVGCPGTQSILLYALTPEAIDEFEEWIPPADYEQRKDEIYKEFPHV